MILLESEDIDKEMMWMIRTCRSSRNVFRERYVKEVEQQCGDDTIYSRGVVGDASLGCVGIGLCHCVGNNSGFSFKGGIPSAKGFEFYTMSC